MNTVRAMRVSQSQNSNKREGFLMAERQKVLIVDDDSNIAEIISLYLIKEMFETKVAEDGYEALELFESFEPDLIILDLMLPGKDG